MKQLIQYLQLLKGLQVHWPAQVWNIKASIRTNLIQRARKDFWIQFTIWHMTFWSNTLTHLNLNFVGSIFREFSCRLLFGVFCKNKFCNFCCQLHLKSESIANCCECKWRHAAGLVGVYGDLAKHSTNIPLSYIQEGLRFHITANRAITRICRKHLVTIFNLYWINFAHCVQCYCVTFSAGVIFKSSASKNVKLFLIFWVNSEDDCQDSKFFGSTRLTYAA